MSSDEIGSTHQGQVRERKWGEAGEKRSPYAGMQLGRYPLPQVRLEIVCFFLGSSLTEVGISQLVSEQANKQKKDFSCHLSRESRARERSLPPSFVNEGFHCGP